MKARNGGVVEHKVTEVDTPKHVSPFLVSAQKPVRTPKQQFNHIETI